MTTTPETVRVVATDPASQGEFVVINAADFDPAVHQPFVEAEPAAAGVAPKRGRKPALPADPASEIQGA